MNEPLVSIVCLTYNHEKYIRDTLEGFLIQETTFPLEILIHDDASTDKTGEIIKEYLEKSEKITAILQKENQWSRGKEVLLDFLLPQSKGKYVAICEGDDYWTDPLKLQKQVDFLKNNQEYSLCVGGFERSDEDTQKSSTVISKLKENDPGKLGYTFTLKDMQKWWITKTLTAVFRKDVLEDVDFSSYKFSRDIHIFYHIVKNHKGFYITENMGVYRIHEGGVNSKNRGRVNINVAYNCYKELWEKNRDEFTRIMNRQHTLALLNYNLHHKYPGNTMKNRISLFFEAFRLTRKMNEVKYLFTAFASINFKKRYRRSIN